MMISEHSGSPVMIFKSAEIRWFTDDRMLLWDIFYRFPHEGPGYQERGRTDLYLATNLRNTGIKVREGLHEIKIRSGPDISTIYGPIEHWTKWSHASSSDLTEVIDDDYLGDWVRVEKKRRLKSYNLADGKLKAGSRDSCQEQGHVEFTEVHFEKYNKMLFTLGLEANSTSEAQLENLLEILTLLEPFGNSFEDLHCCSYPAMLKILSATEGYED